MSEIILWRVFAAAIASVIVGMAWYGRQTFGPAWMRLSNLPPGPSAGGKRILIAIAAAFCTSALMAYVLAHFGIAWGVYDWVGGLELGFWVWLGFIVPLLLGPVLWERKSPKLFAIHAGYWFVVLLFMGVILAL